MSRHEADARASFVSPFGPSDACCYEDYNATQHQERASHICVRGIQGVATIVCAWYHMLLSVVRQDARIRCCTPLDGANAMPDHNQYYSCGQSTNANDETACKAYPLFLPLHLGLPLAPCSCSYHVLVIQLRYGVWHRIPVFCAAVDAPYNSCTPGDYSRKRCTSRTAGCGFIVLKLS